MPELQATVTLDRGKREIVTAADEVHKDIVGAVKKEIMFSAVP